MHLPAIPDRYDAQVLTGAVAHLRAVSRHQAAEQVALVMDAVARAHEDPLAAVFLEDLLRLPSPIPRHWPDEARINLFLFTEPLALGDVSPAEQRALEWITGSFSR